MNKANINITYAINVDFPRYLTFKILQYHKNVRFEIFPVNFLVRSHLRNNVKGGLGKTYIYNRVSTTSQILFSEDHFDLLDTRSINSIRNQSPSSSIPGEEVNLSADCMIHLMY